MSEGIASHDSSIRYGRAPTTLDDGQDVGTAQFWWGAPVRVPTSKVEQFLGKFKPGRPSLVGSVKDPAMNLGSNKLIQHVGDITCPGWLTDLVIDYFEVFTVSSCCQN